MNTIMAGEEIIESGRNCKQIWNEWHVVYGKAI